MLGSKGSFGGLGGRFLFVTGRAKALEIGHFVASPVDEGHDVIDFPKRTPWDEASFAEGFGHATPLQ